MPHYPDPSMSGSSARKRARAAAWPGVNGVRAAVCVTRRLRQGMSLTANRTGLDLKCIHFNANELSKCHPSDRDVHSRQRAIRSLAYPSCESGSQHPSATSRGDSSRPLTYTDSPDTI